MQPRTWGWSAWTDGQTDGLEVMLRATAGRTSTGSNG